MKIKQKRMENTRKLFFKLFFFLAAHLLYISIHPTNIIPHRICLKTQSNCAADKTKKCIKFRVHAKYLTNSDK